MPLPTESARHPELTAETFALCLLLASCLQISENLLPRIPVFPWLRLGLTHLILLPFLLRFGAGKACLLFICRNGVTLIYGGQIFSSFIVSTASGIVTMGVVGYGVWFLSDRKITGLLGASVLLAATFNSMQLLVADRLFVRHLEFYFQLAPLLFWSVVSGSTIAFLVHKNERGFDLICRAQERILFPAVPLRYLSRSWKSNGLLAIALLSFIALFFLPTSGYQLSALVLVIFVVRWRSFKILHYAWPFYFYIAFFHLFRTDGVYLYRDWITREGWDAFSFYALRTTNVILYGQWLSRQIPPFRTRSFGSSWIKGMGFAIPLMPSLFGIGLSLGRSLLARACRKEFDGLLYFAVERLERELSAIIQSNRTSKTDG